MNETGVYIDLSDLLCVLDNVTPYQSFTGADGSGPSHTGGLHGAKKVAGVPLGGTVLGPVGTAFPPLQDEVA